MNLLFKQLVNTSLLHLDSMDEWIKRQSPILEVLSLNPRVGGSIPIWVNMKFNINSLICDRRLSESLSFTSSACPYAWHALPYRRLKHTVGWENSWIYKRSRENRTDSCTHVLSVMVCLMLSVSVLPSGGVSSVLPRIDDGKWLTLRKMICLIRER